MYIQKIGTALAAGSIVMFSIGTVQALAHDLPLGDGKISSTPKKGYLMACQTHFPSSGHGAQSHGDWLNEHNKTWNPALKPVVDGSVKWPGKVSITLKGDTRVISANGLPEVETGIYPIARSDDAYNFDRNPNHIEVHKVLLTLPAMPKVASEPTCIPMGMVGFSLTGVSIFNAVDALGRDAPAHEIQDKCDGHPERTGEYHYHSYSPCLGDTRSGPHGTSDLLGYALDGFGIYGMYENGKKLTTADLDACHGRTSKVMWNGKAQKIYHYVFTEDYPYTIGCFRGKVTVDVHKAELGGQGGGIPGGRGPGPGMLRKVAVKLGVPFETLRRAAGAPPPNFYRIAQRLHMSETMVRRAFERARQ